MRKSRRNPPIKCAVSWCDALSVARGYCIAHYARARAGRNVERLIGPAGIPYGFQPDDPRTWNRRINSDGYVELRHGVSGARERILEHRFVMQEIMGRELLPDETVHHINGVKDDNRPENLELWSSSHPYGQRVEDKVEWATAMLRRYRPELLAGDAE